MTYALFLGCFTFVFGPLLAIFILVISKKSQNVILAMGASFAWLMSILLASSLWMAVKPLRDTFTFIIPFSVLFQEVMRYILWKLYYFAYHQIDMFKEDPSKPSNLVASISMGWGIGATMAMVMQASMLFSAVGPGDLASKGCPSTSVFHVDAVTTLAIALLHIVLSIILFDAYLRKSWFLIGFSVFLHFAASISSVMNQSVSCLAGISLVWICLGLGLIVVWRLVLSNFNSIAKKLH